MTLNFVKYQGTRNDFVLVDNRTGAWQAYLAMQVPQQFATEKDLVAHLCHRQFGVGADGLMLLQNKMRKISISRSSGILYRLTMSLFSMSFVL